MDPRAPGVKGGRTRAASGRLALRWAAIATPSARPMAAPPGSVGAMPPRRRTDPTLGRAALSAWRADPDGTDRATRATAVRHTLDELAAQSPGNSVEVRVPPYGVVQCVDGPRHTRGTPPNVVETDAETWLRLATGSMPWAEALATGVLRVSGTRADLSGIVPLTARDDA